MISNKRMNYYLTHEEASLIRNLLHTERITYKAEGREGGALYNTVVSAINAMEHPEKHQPSEG